jgi:hypothetical protein
LRIGSTITLIAEDVFIDYRCRSIEELDHHVELARFRKFILNLELTNRFIIRVLRPIESARLRVTDFIRLREEIGE